jgi:lipopolysaccharide cholinephosphotransferase
MTAPEASGELMSLDEVQAVLRDMLRAVVELCERQGVEVFLIGGGCLGLVRHGGFVPWDDDLDLCIWAGDMPAFLAAMAELPPHLVVRAKPNRRNPTCQVMDTRTRIVSDDRRNGGSVFIDIVPMMHWRSVATKRLDDVFSWVANATPTPGRTRGRTALKRILCALGLPRVAGWICDGLLHPVFRRHDRVCRAAATGIVSGACGRRWVGRFDHDVVFPLQRATFCGIDVLVPNDLHRFLSRRYGATYMVPIDENARWRHFRAAHRTAAP